MLLPALAAAMLAMPGVAAAKAKEVSGLTVSLPSA
jgi:hypothetical protein